MSEAMIDRETYRKIKKMSREELQNYLVRYVDILLKDQDTMEIDLSALRSEIGQIKGIGEKRLDEIMAVIEKYLSRWAD